jgi:hypothetical protein
MLHAVHTVPTRTFVIVATHWVVPPIRFRESPYVEIIAGQSHDRDSARLTLITRDPVLIDRALALEGSDHRVELNWKSVVLTRRRLVLEAIA